jgi:hypothetical protein
MSPEQLQTLQYFKNDETDFTNRMIDWAGYDYETMFWLNVMRIHLRHSIQVIRGGIEHDPVKLSKLTCVDAVSSAPFPQVLMTLNRLPGLSWGVYEGGSFHIDRREYDGFPKRWLAFRKNEEREADLFQRGFGELIGEKKTGSSWLYLSWNHVQSFSALKYLVKINSNPATHI